MTEYESGFSASGGISKDVEIAKISTEILLDDDRRVYMPGAGGSLISTPTVYKDVVYIGCNDSVFYAITITGRKLWEYRTGGQIVSTAFVDNDVIYLTCYDGHLYALGLEGKLKWKYNAGSKIVSSPIVYKGVVYFGDSNGHLHAVSAANKLLWKFQTGGEVETAVRIYKDVVYVVSYSGKLFALSLGGKKLWSFAVGEMILSCPTVYKDHIYFQAYDSKLHCLDLNGKENWKLSPSIILSGVEGPAIYNNKIYFPCIDGIYCVDFDTKKTLWKVNIGDLVVDFTIHDGIIYAGSSDNKFCYIDAETGKILWKFDAGSMVFCVPSVYKDRVFFGSWNGKLFCLSKSREKLWDVQLSTSPPSQIISYTKKKSSAEIVIEDFKPEDFKVEIKKGEFGGYGSFSHTYLGRSVYTEKDGSVYGSSGSQYKQKKKGYR